MLFPDLLTLSYEDFCKAYLNISREAWLGLRLQAEIAGRVSPNASAGGIIAESLATSPVGFGNLGGTGYVFAEIDFNYTNVAYTEPTFEPFTGVLTSSPSGFATMAKYTKLGTGTKIISVTLNLIPRRGTIGVSESHWVEVAMIPDGAQFSLTALMNGKEPATAHVETRARSGGLVMGRPSSFLPQNSILTLQPFTSSGGGSQLNRVSAQILIITSENGY